MTFAPSRFQQDIFTWITSGEGHGVVEAVAGSGKTTTMIESMKLIPSSKRILFLAFSKAIAQELKERVPAHAEASTLNSLGHRAWCKAAGRVRLEASKTDMIMEGALTELERKRWGYAIRQAVALCKSSGLVPAGVKGARSLVEDEPHVWLDMIERFDIDLKIDNLTGEEARVAEMGFIELARRVLKLSAEQTNVIDFNDQLYLPVIYSVAPAKQDWIFVDEAQDLSPIQQELVMMAVAPGTRVLAVGDSHQAIFGFRGADSQSMPNFKKRLNAVELKLSICYRCPRSHVALAKEFVPHIEASERAVDGEIQEFGDKWDASVFTNRDIIICRNGAPLVRAAFQILSQRVAVRILGRDLGTAIVSLIKKLNARTQNDLASRLQAWREKEIEKLTKKDPAANCDKVNDRADTIVAFMEMFPRASPDTLCREVEKLYSDNTDGILTLSTVHRAKGLEADRVFILNEWLMPSKSAKKPWQKEQEENLQYVALTRAKAFLGYIELSRRDDR